MLSGGGNRDKVNRTAFTLAEVLITLGIIGVVAALTLPTLIANYQKQVWVNQLKKTYATLNEGVKQIVASEGCTTLECAGMRSRWWGTDFSQSKVRDKFVKAFKLENVFTGNMPSNSIYNYTVYDLSGEEFGDFSDLLAVDEYFMIGTTPDGKILVFQVYGYLGPLVIVDINGLKTPNTLGRDIFVFSMFDYKDTAMITPLYSRLHIDFLVSNDYSTGTSEENRIPAINESCSTSSTEEFSDFACAEKIILDGWKMNY